MKWVLFILWIDWHYEPQINEVETYSTREECLKRAEDERNHSRMIVSAWCNATHPKGDV